MRGQVERGFSRLRFEPELEDAYREYLYRRLKRRGPLVAGMAMAFFLIYALLDYLVFPLQLAAWTIPIRLLIAVPLSLLVIIAAWQSWPRQLYVPVYVASYAMGGLAVVLVILAARMQGILMPYDGLFLVLMFGYFPMALPFRTATAICWALFALYLAVEAMTGLPLMTLLTNVTFLASANLIGALGSYMQERGDRSHFLNMLLIRASRRRAEAENRAKTKFLATASHDLRQPLHAMNLMLGHLEERLKGSDEGDIVAKLQQSVRLLNQLLRSLLDISRLSVGIVRPEYSHFRLGPWLEPILADFRAQAREQRMILEAQYPADAVLHSDMVLLERMVRNLLANALKHSRAECIQVRVGLEGKRLRLEVRDDGRGIPETELDAIFEEFHQGSEERGRPSGLGLGLAIVKHLAALMRLEIGVDSALGRGARFWILVPEGDPAQVKSDRPAQEEAGWGLPVRSVLLVEDDTTTREAMSRLLSSWGLQVEVAAHAEQALARALAMPPDWLVSDFRLGAGPDGLTVIGQLRAALGRRLPAILLTADTADDLAPRLPRDVILAHKPLIPAQLRLMLRRLQTFERSSGPEVRGGASNAESGPSSV